MELFEAIQTRRSIRTFREDEVPRNKVKIILESAILAPSEGNLQSWRFYVVTNKEVKEELAKAALDQKFVAQAPVVIVVCTNLQAVTPYGKRGRELYALQSTAAAIENMLLTAVSQGLGACWVGAFREDKVARILNLKTTLRPVALVAVGYSAEEPPSRGRIPVEAVSVFLE
ncbi:MAG: nitroreductase family protein [Theionarchaea archaeon]|nr:nitroreductase family protein [Theionarchaea archaeon]MBU7001715.1 nitroreductase family protein [Theionarchaea archaeon]MBU7021173.1 nitroreductase family protein [Theionarchaea archaeon]MBU7034557.1 nitroreductase family protein [Theionarchaea archaeon]MBU7040163.1 nitroreductase family protein [Theionarchaea archaeon]